MNRNVQKIKQLVAMFDSFGIEIEEVELCDRGMYMLMDKAWVVLLLDIAKQDRLFNHVLNTKMVLSRRTFVERNVHCLNDLVHICIVEDNFDGVLDCVERLACIFTVE